jgi:hypothetical protein
MGRSGLPKAPPTVGGMTVDELLDFHRSVFGPARMDDGDGPLGDDPPSGGSEGKPEGQPEKQLPQSKVNEIVTAETERAKRKALDDVQKVLGVTPEEAAAIIKKAKEDEDAKLDAQQKAEKRASDAEKERDEKVSAATLETYAERADAFLVRAGAPDDDSKLERLRGMLTVKPGATRDEVKKDVEKLKTHFPGLFGDSDPTGGTRRTPHSDPPGAGKRKVSSDAITRGKERAKKHYADRPEPIKPPGL